MVASKPERARSYRDPAFAASWAMYTFLQCAPSKRCGSPVFALRLGMVTVCVALMALPQRSGELAAQDSFSFGHVGRVLPHLCVTLQSATALPEGWRLTRSTPIASGAPIAYNEAPSSLVSLSPPQSLSPLAGRRPVALRTLNGGDEAEFVDGNHKELVWVGEGAVRGRRPLPIPEGVSLLSGVWGGDRWHVFTKDTVGRVTLRSYDSYASPVAIAPPIPADLGGPLQMGSVGSLLVLVTFEYPHRVVAIGHEYDTGWTRLDDLDFSGSAEGRTLPTAPLSVGHLALLTLVDQGSGARTLRLLDPETGIRRDTRIEVATAFVAVDPSGTMYAIRDAERRELLAYSWWLAERPCVHRPQVHSP